MRHGNKTQKIGRTASHRKATLQSMSAALIEHKRIRTTLGKARALRVFVEPILNHAKDDSTASRRQAFRRLQNKEAVKELYGSVAEAIGTRPGGYTRIVKLGQRGGDAAEMAIVEIVDFNDVKPDGGAGTKRRTRRSRVRTGVGEAPASPTSGPSSAPVAEPVTEPATAPEAEPETTPEASVAESDTTPGDAAEAPDTTGDDAAPEDPAAEAAHSDAADPDTTGNSVVPETPSDHASERGGTDHPDAEQGAPTRTGEPPPESQPTNQGRSGHRG